MALSAKLRTGLRLAVSLSVTSSGRRFDILSSFCTDENTKEWLQECECGIIEMNSCVSCLHLSRVKEPLVSVSAICSEVSTYVIRIPRSKFILSNNEPRRARQVREMCLLDGLRPSMISSKTNKTLFWLVMCESGGTQSEKSVTLFSVLRDFVFWSLTLCMEFLPSGGCNTSITMSQQKLLLMYENRLMKYFPLRRCYVTKLRASCKSSLLEQKCGSQECTTFHLKLNGRCHLQKSASWKDTICILMHNIV